MIFTLPSGGEALSGPEGVIQYAEGRRFRLLNVLLPFGLERQIAALALFFKPDVIHLHGGWHPVLFFGACVAKRMGIPILLSLHGSLRPAVVEGDGRIKKKLAWWLYQRRLVNKADMIHVSTETEKADLVRLGFNKPVVTIPNGVDIYGSNEPDGSGSRVQTRPAPLVQEGERIKTVVYLGRLHPLKGLDLLVSAWAEIKDSIVPMTRVEGASRVGSVEAKVTNVSLSWQLVIAGPDEQGTLRALKEQVKRLRLERSVTFAGPLYGEEKMRTLQRADLFVLPTRSDNFGIAVAEALACGVPVITTKGAPWAEVEGMAEWQGSGVAEWQGSRVAGERDGGVSGWQGGREMPREGSSACVAKLAKPDGTTANGRCGWWVEIGVEPLAEALREAMSLTDEERRTMGQHGRRLVETKYRWETVAAKMAAVYSGIVG